MKCKVRKYAEYMLHAATSTALGTIQSSLSSVYNSTGTSTSVPKPKYFKYATGYIYDVALDGPKRRRTTIMLSAQTV